jgi:hypothetical protein
MFRYHNVSPPTFERKSTPTVLLTCYTYTRNGAFYLMPL